MVVAIRYGLPEDLTPGRPRLVVIKVGRRADSGVDDVDKDTCAAALDGDQGDIPTTSTLGAVSVLSLVQKEPLRWWRRSRC